MTGFPNKAEVLTALLPNHWKACTIMADLTEEQKLEIVAALARFREPAAIIAYFQSEHGLEIDHKQVGRYDPQRSYFAGGEKWRVIFDAKRKAYLHDVAIVPIANQGYRLNAIQTGVDAAMKAEKWMVMARLLELAAREVGGMLTNQHNVRIDDNRPKRAIDMSPEERRAAMAEIIRQAMEQRGGSTENLPGVQQSSRGLTVVDCVQ